MDFPVCHHPNPASTSKGVKMIVRLSYDKGKTWPVSRVLYPSPSACSCLAVLPDGDIICLYEVGQEHPYGKIALARFGPDWLEKGTEKVL